MTARHPGYTERLRVAADVLASLIGTPPAAVAMLGAALRMVDGPMRLFAQVFEGYARDLADDREIAVDDDGPAPLCVIQMAYALHRIASLHLDEVLDRLDGADTPPWPAIRSALAAGHNDKARSW